MDKYRKRLAGWKTSLLSYSGRAELIKSTLSSLHIFRGSCFSLPGACIKALDQQAMNFSGDFRRRLKNNHLKTIFWERICKRWCKGGLNIIKSFHRSAKVALQRQVWNIISNNESIWVQWISKKYIKHQSFWDLKGSWGWRNILAPAKDALPHVHHLIGNGRGTRFWLDP